MWWPGCKPFKAKLLAAVTKLQSEGHAVDVLYLSGDKDEATFKEALGHTTFLTLPFSSHKAWIEKVGIDGYPYL